MSQGTHLGDDPANRLAAIGAKLADRPYARRGVPASNDTIRVMLVDDHTLVREGLRVLLRSASDIAVVAETNGGADVVSLVGQFSPHVVVLDLDMPRPDGETTCRALGAAAASVHVLILTMHAEHERLLRMLECGARGYLTKEAAPRELIEAIRVVAAGDIYVRPAAARLLAAAVVPHRAAETARGRFQTLSPREQTILRSVAQGYSGAEIARDLRVSSKTVDAYKRRVEAKLGLSHRTDYVRFGIEAGILGG
jgi:DNA-binding NarL/FixJ family response regulator